MRTELHGYYWPGLGLLVTVILITLIGWLATAWMTRRLFIAADLALKKIPIVKSLYSILKETIESVLGDKRSFSKVALVKIPGTSMTALGFITAEPLDPINTR